MKDRESDLKLNGDQEIFTIKATYDAQELYGKVIGSREVTVCRQ
jgi:hypothetical protein